VTRLIGLFQRGSAYYIKVVLPLDHPLKAQYSNGRLVQSLGACSYREAVQRGTLKRVEVLWAPTLLTPSSSTDQTAPAAPPASPIKSVQPDLTIRSVYSRWRLAKARSDDSVAACGRAVTLFEECLGKDLDLRTLARAQGDTFRAWLLAMNSTTKTTYDRFTWVKSLLKYAVRDLEALPRSPWEGMDVETKTTAKRRPWKSGELELMFSQPLFTRYEFPPVTPLGFSRFSWGGLWGWSCVQGFRIASPK
jgi:hypothetical protein